MVDDPKKQQEQQERLDRLQALGLGGGVERHFSTRHTRIVKFLKIALPLSAFAVVLLLVTWQRVEHTSIERPKADQEQTVRAIGKNELLNPKFESVDKDGHPYVVTAKRALQGQGKDDDVILLEDPVADISLDDDGWLAVKASQSAFRQTSKRLLLKGAVEVYYGEGYTLSTEVLDVDMQAGTAQSHVDVHVEGARGVLDAKGMSADREQELLVFKGPAKLVLNEGL